MTPLAPLSVVGLRWTLLLFALSIPVLPAEGLTRETAEYDKVATGYPFNYLLYKPLHYADDPNYLWPMIVSLHGSGLAGTTVANVAISGLPAALEGGREIPAIVVSPQSPNPYWSSSDVEGFIQDVANLYRVDPKRIYVTGWSAGGYAAWDLAVRGPTKYAAIVPIAGGGDPTLAYKIRDLPIWAFHGAQDPTVPLSETVNMINAIKSAGGNPKLTIYPTLGHDSWDTAYQEDTLYTWLLALERGPPVISIQPAPVTVPVAGSAAFSVTLLSSDGQPLSYQWEKDGVPISGATNALFSLGRVSPGDAGNYSVKISNPDGTILSNAAPLVVDTPRHGRLSNLSLRSQAGLGIQSSIVGFIITGTGQKPLMVRCIGPTLTEPMFGLSGVLADPQLTLYNQATVIGSNDDWGSSPNLSAIVAANGDKAGNVPLDPKEAIFLGNFSATGASGFTAVISDKTGVGGIALTELFDISTSSPGTSDFDAEPRLSNISGRAQVGVGADILIAGFIINGNFPKRIMIRATGPTLANFGVTGFLFDPSLSLFSGNEIIAQNDNWFAAPNVDDIVAANGNNMGAFSLDHKDAVLVITLAPGAYTAEVSGTNGATGVALVEIFDLDP